MSDIKVNEIKTDTIKNQAGTSALSINSAGVATTSVKHAFYMYRNPTQSITHASSFNLIEFNNSRIDEGGGVTLGSSAKYTVPVGGAGMYVLHCHGRVETGTDGNITIQMRLNGTAIATTYHHNGYYDGITVPMLRNLSEGDYVQCYTVSYTHLTLPTRRFV